MRRFALLARHLAGGDQQVDAADDEGQRNDLRSREPAPKYAALVVAPDFDEGSKHALENEQPGEDLSVEALAPPDREIQDGESDEIEQRKIDLGRMDGQGSGPVRDQMSVALGFPGRAAEGEAYGPRHVRDLAVAAAVEETTQPRQRQAEGDPRRAEIRHFPHAHAVLAREVQAECGGEEEPTVKREPAAPDLEHGETIARRMASMGCQIADVVVAAFAAGVAQADLGLGGADLEIVHAQIDVVVQMPVGDHVQHARADDGPDDDVDVEVEYALAVEAEARCLAIGHPRADDEAEREQHEVRRQIQVPEDRNVDAEINQNRAHSRLLPAPSR